MSAFDGPSTATESPPGPASLVLMVNVQFWSAAPWVKPGPYAVTLPVPVFSTWSTKNLKGLPCKCTPELFTLSACSPASVGWNLTVTVPSLLLVTVNRNQSEQVETGKERHEKTGNVNTYVVVPPLFPKALLQGLRIRTRRVVSCSLVNCVVRPHTFWETWKLTVKVTTACRERNTFQF